VAETRDTWRELIRQTADYLAILRDGGFAYVEGKVEPIVLPTAQAPSGRRTAGPARPAPSPLSVEQREALKAALTDPYAHLAGPGRGAPPLPARPPSAPRAVQATPPSTKLVTLRDRAEGTKVIAAANDLDRLRYLVSGCQMCGLAAGRTLAVPGEGNPKAGLMFIGEGPGYHEDVQGKPFVGRAGALLTQMIQAMGLQRVDVFITNIVKCRPPGNRDPEPDEIKACEPYLKRQIELIRPRVICALGRIAIQGLLRDTTPITKLRGNWRTYQGIPLMPTFHPAYLLRNPAEKRAAWEDLKAVMAKLAGQT